MDYKNFSINKSADGIPDVKAPIDGVIGFDWDQGDPVPF